MIYEAVSPETKGDLLYRERGKDRKLGEPVVFLQTPFNEATPRFSPGGRFVAYMSDESGNSVTVYATTVLSRMTVVP